MCNALKPGYYEDVLFLVREINANLPPRVTIGYDHVKNMTFLKAPLNTSLIFHGKLAIILGLKSGVPLGSVNQSCKDHSGDAPVVTYAPHQADIRGAFYSMYIVKEFFLWSIKSSVKHRFKMYASSVFSLVVRKAFFV